MNHVTGSVLLPTHHHSHVNKIPQESNFRVEHSWKQMADTTVTLVRMEIHSLKNALRQISEFRRVYDFKINKEFQVKSPRASV